MNKNHVNLSSKDRNTLSEMLSKGSLKSRTYKRITALLELDRGKTYVEVMATVQSAKTTLLKLANRYSDEGLPCLYDHPRPGRPIEITEELKDQITVLACDESPDGYSQWSVRLLANKVVELGYCDNISHTQVHKILKKKDKASLG